MRLSINPLWWQHLAPKGVHDRRREVEELLREWCRSGYGAHWLSSARHDRGVMRVKPGDAIPVASFLALGGNSSLTLMPQWKVRDGHRFVGTTDLRGGPLQDGELVMQPTILVEIVRDATMIEAARVWASGLPKEAETIWGMKVGEPRVLAHKEPSLIFSIPAHYLLSPTTWPKRAYVLYQHIFGDGPSYPNDGFFYVGVTTRSWQQRWLEHRSAVETGSPLLFHRKLREETKAKRVTYLHHKVMGITDRVDLLYDAEERLVAGHWEDTRRLNMIPGGKAGIAYMREHGMLGERIVPMPDEREHILAEWLHEHPRKGLPAPWVSEKWKDDDWAIAQICGRDGRLTVEQVRAIRGLAAAHSAEEIASRIGARNTDQVQRVIDGETYTRIQ